MHKLINLYSFAFTDLKRSPAFVFSILATLGLTLGALIIAFNVNYLLFFKALPYGEEPIYTTLKTATVNGEERVGGTTYPGMVYLYQHQAVLDDAVLVTSSTEIVSNFKIQPQVDVLYSTPEYFDLFAVDMILGRKFDHDIGIEETAPVAVISYTTWMSLYGGDEAVLEEKLVINNISFSIIGVTAKDFVQPEIFRDQLKAGVFIPWDFNSTLTTKRDRWDYQQNLWLLLGKLKQGVSLAQADHLMSEQLNVAFRASEPGQTFFKDLTVGVDFQSFEQFVRTGTEDAAMYVLAGAIALILVALANLVILFLSRSAQKQRTLSLRVALGAKKSHIFRMLLAESSLLMFGSLIIAMLIAILGMDSIKAYASDYVPRSEELGFSLVTLTLSILVCVCFSFIFAGISSHLIKYRQLQSTLQSSGKGSGLQISKRIRFLLVACQVFIVTLILAVNTNIFTVGVKTLSQPLSFDEENLYVLQLTNPTSPLTHDEIKDKIYAIKSVLKSSIIGMDGISATFNNPITTRFGLGVGMEASRDAFVGANGSRIDQDTFAVLNKNLVQGRTFTQAEIQDQTKVLVINESLAKRLYPEQNAIGKDAYLHWDKEPFKIVGIVGDTAVYSENRNEHDVYFTLRFDRFLYLMRFDNIKPPTREELSEILRLEGIDQKVFEYESISYYLGEEVAELQFITAFIFALSIVAIVLASLGIYGVLNYSITLRSFELGVRMAIGAKSKDIIVLVCKDESRPVLAGIVLSIALVGILFLSARTSSELFEELSLYTLLSTLFIVSCAVVISISIPLSRIVRVWPEKILKRQD